MDENHQEIIILGSGPAGYTAAIYATRAGRKTTLITGMQKGGQLTMTSHIENFPGFPEKITGFELMDRMEKQAINCGTKIITDLATKVNLNQRPFQITTSSNQQYTSDALIIATGASAKYLGIPGEEQYKNRGVSACAVCDGMFFRNQTVAVTGGGDTAAEEAAYLSKICQKVYLIHRRDQLRASQAMQQQVLHNPQIELIWNTTIEEVLGDQSGVTSLKLKNLKNDQTSILPVTGLFVAIGHQPNTQLFNNILKMDQKGYLITLPGTTQTNLDGVFACGDVMDPIYRQGITSAGKGAEAAIAAEHYLNTI